MFDLTHLPLRRSKKLLLDTAMRRRALLLPLVVFIGIGILTHALLVAHVIRTAGPLNPPSPRDARLPPDPLPEKLRKSLEQRIAFNAALKPRLVAKPGVLELHQGRISFDEHPDYMSPEGNGKSVQFKCRSCALVGNSGLLLQSGIGKQIDSTDCVFRIGFSPLHPYEDDVGQKTTARVMELNSNLGSQKAFLRLRNTKHVFIHDSNNYDLDVNLAKIAEQLPMTELYLFSSVGMNRAELKLIEEKRMLRLRANRDYISSVWFAFLIMEDAHCNNIRIYGIPGPNYCRNHASGFIPSHYWNLHSNSLCEATKNRQPHDVPSLLEKQILKAFAVPYNVTFQEPRWEK